jgi:hypothetical protein
MSQRHGRDPSDLRCVAQLARDATLGLTGVYAQVRASLSGVRAR